MIDNLSEEDFLFILTAAEKIDGVVIGGQALNLWADVLLSYDEYESLGPFTSKDLDFWGTQAAAEELAKTLDGKVLLPEKWDSGPSEAAVIVTLTGKNHQIDFLKIVCGLDTKAFLKRASEIELKGVNIALLHPLDVLKSREAGVRLLKRVDPGAIRQLRAAPIITHHFIETLLDDGQVFAAQDVVAEMIHIGSRPNIDLLYSDYGFDPLSLAASLSQRPEWDPRFAKYQIAQRCEREAALRSRRIAEAQRRREHRGS